MSTDKKVAPEMQEEISSFGKDKLKHTDTVEKNTLPSPEGLNAF